MAVRFAPSDPTSSPVRDAKRVLCTDPVCLLLFGLLISVVSLLSCYAVLNGNPWRLIYATDCYGNVCNSQNKQIPSYTDSRSSSGLDLRGKPYLLHYAPTSPRLSHSVCVERCPDEHIAANVQAFVDYQNRSGVNLCDYQFDQTAQMQDSAEGWQFGATGRCPQLPIEPQRPLYYHCVPVRLYELYRPRKVTYWMRFSQLATNASAKEPDEAEPSETDVLALRNVFSFFSASNLQFQLLLADAYAEWSHLFLIALVMFGTSAALLFAVLIRPDTFMRVCMIVGVISSLALLILSWVTYVSVKRSIAGKTAEQMQLWAIKTSSEWTFLAVACVGSVVALFLLGMLIAVRRRFRALSGVMDEASGFLRRMRLLAVQPLLTLLLLAVFLTAWLLLFAFIVTCDQSAIDVSFEHARSLVYNVTGFRNATPCVVYLDTLFSKLASAFHVAVLIYMYQFAIGVQQFCVAYTVTSHYFANVNEPPKSPILTALIKLCKHHLGTVAFTSFLLPLLCLPRLLLLVFSSSRAHFAYLCTNTSAYALVASHKYSYCEASRASRRLLLHNGQRVDLVASASEFIMFLAKLGCTIAAASMAVAVVNRHELHFYAVFVSTAAVYASSVVHCLLSSYECVVDVLLLCHCQDCKTADKHGIAQRNYCPTGLHQAVTQAAQRFSRLARRPDDGTRTLLSQNCHSSSPSDCVDSRVHTLCSVEQATIVPLHSPDFTCSSCACDQKLHVAQSQAAPNRI